MIRAENLFFVCFIQQINYAANWRTAMRRVEKIKAEYEALGFHVWVNKHFNSGVDMMVFDNKARLVEVLEITNYASPEEYISKEKFERYVRCLNEFDCFKEIRKKLVVSYRENLNDKQLEILKQNNIVLEVRGGQD